LLRLKENNVQIPLNACCLGGPAAEQPPLSAGTMLVLAAFYGAGALIVLFATVAFLR
jgi:hypothetical protein